jgi:hypothetical protein
VLLLEKLMLGPLGRWRVCSDLQVRAEWQTQTEIMAASGSTELLMVAMQVLQEVTELKKKTWRFLAFPSRLHGRLGVSPAVWLAVDLRMASQK